MTLYECLAGLPADIIEDIEYHIADCHTIFLRTGATDDGITDGYISHWYLRSRIVIGCRPPNGNAHRCIISFQRQAPYEVKVKFHSRYLHSTHASTNNTRRPHRPSST